MTGIDQNVTAGVCLCGAFHEVLPPKWSCDAAPHRRHRLVLVVAGNLVLNVAGNKFALASGDAALIPPDTACSECNGGNRETRRAVITFEWKECEAVPFHVLHDSTCRLRELAQWLIADRDASFPGVEGYRRNVLRLLVGECQRLGFANTATLEQRIRGFVLERIDQNITLEMVAEHMGIGRYHLCRKFRDETGKSPMSIVRAIRVELARELIRCTQLPLKEVAVRVGLQSEQHLSRLLRAQFGTGVRGLRRSSNLDGRSSPQSKESA